MLLVIPSLEHLPSYRAALESGWSPNTLSDAAIAQELARIDADPALFVASMVDREARGGPITMPDGTLKPRLPGIRLWMWDNTFCGSIGLRWQPGTEELPSYVLGHIGYSVFPSMRNRGYATRALAEILPYAKAEGLRYVDLTTDLDNVASQRTILANGGVLQGEFTKDEHYGVKNGLRYRIGL
jgi:predicted acetyltransferase